MLRPKGECAVWNIALATKEIAAVTPSFAGGRTMLHKLVCLFSGHRINRRRVRHPRGVPHTRCLRCQSQVSRGTNGWRRTRPVEA